MKKSPKIELLNSKQKDNNLPPPEIIKPKIIMTEIQLKNILDSLESVVATSPIEKIPKTILSKIFSLLEYKEICKIWVLNKFFFKFLFDSSIYSDFVWKSFIDASFPYENMNLEKHRSTPFEMQANKLYFIAKVKKKKRKRKKIRKKQTNLSRSKVKFSSKKINIKK